MTICTHWQGCPKSQKPYNVKHVRRLQEHGSTPYNPQIMQPSPRCLPTLSTTRGDLFSSVSTRCRKYRRRHGNCRRPWTSPERRGEKKSKHKEHHHLNEEGKSMNVTWTTRGKEQQAHRILCIWHALLAKYQQWWRTRVSYDIAPTGHGLITNNEHDMTYSREQRYKRKHFLLNPSILAFFLVDIAPNKNEQELKVWVCDGFQRRDQKRCFSQEEWKLESRHILKFTHSYHINVWHDS